MAMLTSIAVCIVFTCPDSVGLISSQLTIIVVVQMSMSMSMSVNIATMSTMSMFMSMTIAPMNTMSTMSGQTIGLFEDTECYRILAFSSVCLISMAFTCLHFILTSHDDKDDSTARRLGLCKFKVIGHLVFLDIVQKN